jgi:hypothetical protein
VAVLVAVPSTFTKPGTVRLVYWFNNFMRDCFLVISTQTNEPFNLNFAAKTQRPGL